MAEIQLNGRHGGVAIVDDSDYPAVSALKWHSAMTKSGLYAYGPIGPDGRAISMHAFLIGKKPGMVIDHANGNPLDNRRANLRHCSHADNLKNQKKKRDTASRYKGVSIRPRGKWRASIEVNGIEINLGLYTDQKAAARQYDRAARLFHGKFARTNQALGLLQDAVG